MSSGGGTLMLRRAFSSSEKLKLQFVSSRQKAADYMKMQNDSSLAQKGRRLFWEEWIFHKDNATIDNASITKKCLLEQKIRLFDHPACSPNLKPIENVWGLIVAKVYKGVDSA